MEENKPFMPPPPPKMPPPPPRTDITSQPEQMQEEEKVEAVEELSVQSQEEGKTPENQETATGEAVVQENFQKVEAPKVKKKVSVSTMLYWAGFALCLVGIGLSIFFLVK